MLVIISIPVGTAVFLYGEAVGNSEPVGSSVGTEDDWTPDDEVTEAFSDALEEEESSKEPVELDSNDDEVSEDETSEEIVDDMADEGESGKTPWYAMFIWPDKNNSQSLGFLLSPNILRALLKIL